MRGTVNRVILVGNLGKDPLREDLENGVSRVSFPLATSESWSDQFQGKRKKMREWHQIVCLDQRLADLTMRKCRKGTQVLVEGGVTTRKCTLRTFRVNPTRTLRLFC
ncbi:single-stranded DNA-binding protein [Acetobacter indonesiensis]|uniref:single-stranded DNA-binding protein n=1 Tax=Acetobacter indonesiensis TaxID=104101 RepID=UPI0034310364